MKSRLRGKISNVKTKDKDKPKLFKPRFVAGRLEHVIIRKERQEERGEDSQPFISAWCKAYTCFEVGQPHLVCKRHN